MRKTEYSITKYRQWGNRGHGSWESPVCLLRSWSQCGRSVWAHAWMGFYGPWLLAFPRCPMMMSQRWGPHPQAAGTCGWKCSSLYRPPPTFLHVLRSGCWRWWQWRPLERSLGRPLWTGSCLPLSWSSLLSLSDWEIPRHPFQDAWKSQSPLQRAPCSSPCMGCWRMRRRKRSAGSCAPIGRQRSWSHSLMAVCLRGGKRIRFLKREREKGKISSLFSLGPVHSVYIRGKVDNGQIYG